jgi:nitronate monooxygenase
MPLQELLGTELPIIQAPMAGVQGGALVIAACKAGALGSLPCAMLDADVIEAHGADAVIAQGLEAGGHRGMFLSEELGTQIGTFALLPQVVQAVKIPVIAAGGIAHAKGVAAAMALGAAGVQVGTAYMLCRGKYKCAASSSP